MKELDKENMIRKMERKLLKEAHDRYDLEVHEAEMDVLHHMLFPFGEDEIEIERVERELIGILVEECPNMSFFPASGTLKRVIYGEN